MTSSTSIRHTSCLVSPAYVILLCLFVWTLHLHWKLHLRPPPHEDKEVDEERMVEVDRVRREASSSTPVTGRRLANMLNTDHHGDVLYDMEFEPCGGAVYVLWGRATCPLETDTETVYSGVVGGTNIESYGGGVDYLCLSRHPQWDSYRGNRHEGLSVRHLRRDDPSQADTKAECRGEACPGAEDSPSPGAAPTPPPSLPSTRPTSRLLTREALVRFLSRAAASNTGLSRRADPRSPTGPGGSGDAFLYGAEFQGAEPQFRRDNLKADTFEDQDVVCAVCRSKVRLSKVMIPGRRECYAGWTKEYDGYLMTGPAGARAQHRFVCVDRAPEVNTSGFRREGGAVFYHVRAMCGSLPCPTYIQGREVTCVVCTK